MSDGIKFCAFLPFNSKDFMFFPLPISVIFNVAFLYAKLFNLAFEKSFVATGLNKIPFSQYLMPKISV